MLLPNTGPDNIGKLQVAYCPCSAQDTFTFPGECMERIWIRPVKSTLGNASNYRRKQGSTSNSRSLANCDDDEAYCKMGGRMFLHVSSLKYSYSVLVSYRLFALMFGNCNTVNITCYYVDQAYSTKFGPLTCAEWSTGSDLSHTLRLPFVPPPTPLITLSLWDRVVAVYKF